MLNPTNYLIVCLLQEDKKKDFVKCFAVIQIYLLSYISTGYQPRKQREGNESVPL